MSIQGQTTLECPAEVWNKDEVATEYKENQGFMEAKATKQEQSPWRMYKASCTKFSV